MLTVKMSVIAIVLHQFGSELPGSPGEKRDIMNNIVFIIRKMNSYHVL